MTGHLDSHVPAPPGTSRCSPRARHAEGAPLCVLRPAPALAARPQPAEIAGVELPDVVPGAALYADRAQPLGLQLVVGEEHDPPLPGLQFRMAWDGSDDLDPIPPHAD